MMRRQLPAVSPVPLSAVMAGLRALIGGPVRSPREAARLLTARFGASRVLLLDSGTSALALAIAAAARARPGRPVALPAWGCYDLATAADAAGVPVILYDLDPVTLGPDPGSLRAALERGPAALVAAHAFGVPLDMPALTQLCRDAGVLLIEDAAQAAGAGVGGRPAGAYGPLTVLSFGRGKGMTGGGGGALLATGNEDIPWPTEVLRPGGRGARAVAAVAAQWVLGRPRAFGLVARLPWLRIGQTVYRSVRAPRAIPVGAASVLVRAWTASLHAVDGRRTSAARWEAGLPANWSAIRPPAAADPGWLRFPVVAPSPAAAVLDAGALALGLAPGYPLSLADLPGFSHRVIDRDRQLPGARLLATRLITAPTHALVTDGDRAAALAWMARRG